MYDKGNSIFAEKDFRSHIRLVEMLLRKGVPFAFNRISDGEMFMLQRRRIELGARGAEIDGIVVNRQKFSKWDEKSFDPERDTYILSELPKVLQSTNPLYLLGVPCPCCGEKSEIQWVRNASSATLTWANLLVNSNYKYFIESVFPYIQTQRVMAALNHIAKEDAFSSCPSFSHFKVPNNVIQCAQLVVERFLERCSSLQRGTVVLVGASVVAKIMIHKGYKEYPNLTFIDVGTTLNPIVGLGLGRDYLRDYWLRTTKRQRSPYSDRICIW